MKRAPLTLLLAASLALVAFGADRPEAHAQAKKPAAAKAGAKKPAAKKGAKPPAEAEGAEGAEGAEAETEVGKGKGEAKVKEGETTPDGAPVVVGTKQAGDAGVKTYTFGPVEVEGRLKSPQVIYFLRRVRAEFAAGDLGHRSFLRELSDTRRSPAIR